MIRFVFMAATALSLFSISAGAAVNSYHLNTRVERDNLIVADSEFDVDEGADADLQMRSREGTFSSRIIARVERADTQSNDAVVHLQYFEKRSKSWALVGEPTLVLTPGVEGLMTFTDDPSRPVEYKIAIKLEPQPDGRQDQFVLGSSGCRDNGQSIETLGSYAPQGPNPKCCSTRGTTCCGVKRCCDNRLGGGDCCDTK